MKKINTGLLILCICFAISCTKTAPNAGTWTFEGKTYHAAVAARPDTPGIALAAAGLSSDGDASVLFFFNSYPTASGMYTVVSSMTPASGQVGIQLGFGNEQYPGNLYTPTGTTSPEATVTVSGGKVNISVPSIMLVNQIGYYTNVDSGLFTASIYQTQ